MCPCVALKKCRDYAPEKISASISAVVATLGGIERYVKPGDKVLLKPNLLVAAAPDKAVTTHPEVVKAVAQLVMDAGGKPFIADSPAVKGFRRVARVTGMEAVAEELGIPCFPLGESVVCEGNGKNFFHLIEISRNVLEADRVINLPKLKTHSMMLMTMAVKNLFGCVVGARKPQWHWKAGVDRLFFAKMIVEVYKAVSPDLNIIDAVIGMEGDGPGSAGTPIECSFVAASDDGVALDRVMLEIIGIKETQLYTNVAAGEMGVGCNSLDSIETAGDDIASLKLDRFVLPEIADIFPWPEFMRKILNDRFAAQPVEDKNLCTLCGKCAEICPTGIITDNGKKLSFDYSRCIRCFCCVEVCPEGAMRPHKPFFSKLVDKL